MFQSNRCRLTSCCTPMRDHKEVVYPHHLKHKQMKRYNFKLKSQKVFMMLVKSSDIPMHLRFVPAASQYTLREILYKYPRDISPSLPLNQNIFTAPCFEYHSVVLLFYSPCDACSSVCLPLCLPPSLSPSLSVSLFSFLSSPNQEIWPMTLQLNAIKVLSILWLVAPRKRQCSIMQYLISALDVCLYIFSLSYSLTF